MLKNLKQEPDKFKEYDDIVRSQLQEGIVEIAPEIADKNKEFYLTHKPVYREDAETTKVRVIYNASAKATKDSLSLSTTAWKQAPCYKIFCGTFLYATDLNQLVFVQISKNPFSRLE